MRDINERFWSKVSKTDYCWNWIGFKDKDGYGQFGENSHIKHRAHRFSYEIYNGKIQNDLTIDHLCKNKSCVNPNHLEVVTLKENIRRSISFNGNKKFCKKGHEFNPINTYYHQNSKRKYRNCRVCIRGGKS